MSGSKKSHHFNSDKSIDNSDLGAAGLDIIVDSSSDFGMDKHKIVFLKGDTLVTLKGKFTWDLDSDNHVIMSSIDGNIQDIEVKKSGSFWQFHSVSLDYSDMVADLNDGVSGDTNLFTSLFNVSKVVTDGSFFNDKLYGASQNDSINAWSGDDQVFGAGGNDTIQGYNGADTIHGGDGNDRLRGGLGEDNFVFDTTPNSSTNVDRLDDFKHGQDHVWLDQSIYSAFTSTGTISADNFYVVGQATPQDANDYLVYNKSTHQLIYDADGSGSDPGVVFATIDKHAEVTYSDFVVIPHV